MIRRLSIAGIAAALLAGCAVAPDPIQQAEHVRRSLEDRAAMFAIPGWGWALAGLAVAGGVLASIKLGSADKPGKKSGLKRDAERQALGGDVGAMGAGGGVAKRGDGLGTFSGMIASQLGIGPALTAQEETADNTKRMADGVDNLVRQGGLRVPAAAGLQIGMAPPAVRGGVTRRSRTAA